MHKYLLFLKNFTNEKGKWVKEVKYKVQRETPQYYVVGGVEFDKKEEGSLFRVGEIVYPNMRSS